MRRLLALKLQGFKSFGNKTDIEFTTSVTAVVGPNGSGKSNVVEALRFVLGEQSMKSMRGKSGSDLVFKGSKILPKQNRASVSIVFDNKDRVFKIGDESSINVDFEKIEISREVFSDGSSTYKINGSDVRLKDIVELLSSLNIGASGHHIISQGEADRILSSSAKDRKQMIEDALGLKIFQIRIKEGQRKLDKTREHLKEVEVSRREIAPHLRFLKKQVEKVEEAKSLREDLSSKYSEYLKIEESYIKSQKEFFDTKSKELNDKKKELEDSLAKESKNIPTESGSQQFKIEEERIEKDISEIRKTKDEINKNFAKIEVLLEMEEAKKRELSDSAKRDAVTNVPFAKIKDFAINLEEELGNISKISDISSVKDAIERSIRNIKSFIEKYSSPVLLNSTIENHEEKIKELLLEKSKISTTLNSLEERELKALEKLESLKASKDQKNQDSVDSQRKIFEIKSSLQNIQSEIDINEVREESFKKEEVDFDNELKEGSVLIGESILGFRTFELKEGIETNRDSQYTRKKDIEKIKIKLESFGAGDSGDIMKEYESVVERDNFLQKEIDDINDSISSLEKIIEEFQVELDNRFKDGVQKINNEFKELFSLMFGGGSAGLSFVKNTKKISSEDEIVEDEDEQKEEGIEISVNLPHKKVRELEMLSGGERSLTSIALLFAISQVNPPPFLVLDETDAALDEANSKRYGSMLDRLSKFSQLIVVTHNRETMSHAGVLYGVTVGKDGASKLLSIEFNDAESYAK